MIKVTKFGGSSLASSSQFKKVKSILDEDSTRRFVIVSAVGKVDSSDHKVTDLLYLIHAHIKYGVPYSDMWQSIKDKYLKIKEELNLSIDLEEEFSLIEYEMQSHIDLDYLISRGEYLCAKLMANYLNGEFIDAKDIIFFEYNGDLNYPKITNALNKIKTDKRLVIPGFYGAYPNNKLKLMSRGGSDITGAIVANVVGASLYENFTDVSGIMIADPHIIKDPKVSKRITYNELRELSYMGANVLHDEAVFPVKLKNIPIHILNTNDPKASGTLILENSDELDKDDPPYAISGITGRKDFNVISASKSHASSEVGVLQSALKIVADYGLRVESVPTGIDSFSIVYKSTENQDFIYELMAELKDKLKLDSVKLEEGLALVAVVGRKMKDQKGFSGKLFAALGDNDINIRLISQTTDEISIIIGVMNEDFEKTINCIYKRFVL